MVFTTPSALTVRALAIDAACVAVFAGIGGAMEGGAFSSPVKRGFFRNDESIMHPYLDDEAISTPVLLVYSFLAPVIILPLIDLVTIRKSDDSKRTLGMLHRLLMFLWGFGLVVFFTAMIKHAVGRLRPDFIGRCAPNWSLVPDNATWIDPSIDICTGDASAISKGRRSFPSGHASVSAYSMFYLAAYLVMSIPKRWQLPRLVPSFILLLPGICIVFSAATRTSEYVHHAGDVLAGIILAGFAVLYTICVLLKPHFESKKCQCNKKTDGTSIELPTLADDSPA